jgi:hypothetical protein
MISRRIFASWIPESVAEAYDGVQSLVACDGTASLEELQGAVEHLLDTVKAARGLGQLNHHYPTRRACRNSTG